eukprot:CAMPEP_0117503412 /NCGR_PEP_ID=MMETSP0784-20121206/24317_1 /TAXON_ID=39447 /ORGANISM="" /LENGTH=48 /DNA_ID= /DNA_START= /DNA_END= /DNA_ORIENTATION=
MKKRLFQIGASIGRCLQQQDGASAHVSCMCILASRPAALLLAADDQFV